MNNFVTGNGCVLITGGTSGLGLELVKIYLAKGLFVTVLGRDPSKLPLSVPHLRFVSADFSDLDNLSAVIFRLCETDKFNKIINNAGVLSPPSFTLTKNNLEYTFQVNFLAHLLINEIIIRKKEISDHLIISSVTSPVYKLTGDRLKFDYPESEYRPLKAYSDSKYMLSLMCRYLTGKYNNNNVRAFSFNPGTFRSDIYRMQKPWFRNMYRIAAPFMKSPAKVARVLAEITENTYTETGKIYDQRRKSFSLPFKEAGKEKALWEYCFKKINRYFN